MNIFIIDSKIARMEQNTDNNKHITNSIKKTKPVIIERGRAYKIMPYPMEDFFGFNKAIYIDLCLKKTLKKYNIGNRDFKVGFFRFKLWVFEHLTHGFNNYRDRENNR